MQSDIREVWKREGKFLSFLCNDENIYGRVCLDLGTAFGGALGVDKNSIIRPSMSKGNSIINGTAVTQEGTLSGNSDYNLWIFDNDDAGNNEYPFIG